MKRKILTLILAATVVGLIPVSAYASDVTNKTEKAEEVITSHKMLTEVNDEGIETLVGLISYEQQSDEESMMRAGCSSGHHIDVVNNGTPETTRIHGKTHPGYCKVRTTTYWRCRACNTTGHDDKYTLAWCTSPNVSGDEEAEGPGAA